MHENHNLFLFLIEINNMHHTRHILPKPPTVFGVGADGAVFRNIGKRELLQTKNSEFGPSLICSSADYPRPMLVLVLVPGTLRPVNQNLPKILYTHVFNTWRHKLISSNVKYVSIRSSISWGICNRHSWHWWPAYFVAAVSAEQDIIFLLSILQFYSSFQQRLLLMSSIQRQPDGHVIRQDKQKNTRAGQNGKSFSRHTEMKIRNTGSQLSLGLGLPGVRVLTGQSGFLAICKVKNMMLNRTISCPVFVRPWKLHEILSVDSQQNH